MEEEIWLPIPFASGYFASNLGNILGRRGRILNPTVTLRDYLVISIDRVQYRVNRLVCLAFHGKPPSEMHHAAHKDSNRQNNREDNLYWATPKENAEDLDKTNNLKGDNTRIAKLTTIEVLGMRTMYDFGIHISAIARMHPHVSHSTISHAVLERTWTHL